VSQVEAWQMVNVRPSFLDSKHGKIGCTGCHGGDATASEMEKAHTAMVAAPSDGENLICGTCHGDIAADHSGSLHKTMKGYYHLIEKRLGRDISTDSELVDHFNQECGKCHASCGQCHVSRPVSVQGGFVQGHNFFTPPDNKENCTACHGSRVGAEFYGENEGLAADVHWIPNVKRCEFCHDAASIHSTSSGARTRMEDTDIIRCESCHSGSQSSNRYHRKHWGELSCQVCHSQPYKNCNSCHTGGAGITGSSYMTLKIAKNPLLSTSRPYQYVTVRHIPIARDTYASWGIADLPNYDSVPTWKYATPHNIKRWTAQTDTSGGAACAEKCHKSSYYLTLDDLPAEEVEANRAYVLTR